ncbi:hypothetical protein B0H16DRAFT_1475495 [Mycena metata]|uniref:Uncharacterized protein n=1 Tax=Mycena metata TaxID=1033252 RepID=A0AAD7HE53_9AGAR|nr:hypothetical protein B0H16DRAFT_1475495 [Mycena metata]
MAQSMVVARVPDGLSLGHEGPYAHPQISGDFAAVVVVTDIVLINWREGIFVTIHIDSTSPLFMNFCRLVLNPEHVILLLPGVRDRTKTKRYPGHPSTLSPFRREAQPALELFPKFASNVPSLSEEDTHGPTSGIVMSVYESPIQVGLFRRIYINRARRSGTTATTSNCVAVTPSWDIDQPRTVRYLGQSAVHVYGSPFSGHTVQGKHPSSFYLMPPGLYRDGGDIIDRSLEMKEQQTSFLHFFAVQRRIGV